MSVRVVVADDHTVVLDGLKAVLGLEPGIDVVALCTDGLEAIEAVQIHQPDVLVLDVTMPRCDGLEAYEALGERGATVPTVILSATLAENTALRCLQAGVEGIVMKDSAASTLVDAIRAVARGERCIPPDLAARAFQPTTSPGIELQLPGGPTIEGTDLLSSSPARRRHPLALMAIVAAGAPHAVSRDRIMALLWPDSDSVRANNSLRQTLYILRRDLGEDLFLPEPVSGIQIDTTRVWVDLWEFRNAMGSEAPADAVALYHGPFLDDFHIPGLSDFSHWAESERGKIAREYSEALDTLATRAEREGRPSEAVTWRRRQAAAEPYSSRVALGLLRALDTAGDRPGALSYAKVYTTLVRDHLESEPDPAVVEFVRSLREPHEEQELFSETGASESQGRPPKEGNEPSDAASGEGAEDPLIVDGESPAGQTTISGDATAGPTAISAQVTAGPTAGSPVAPEQATAGPPVTPEYATAGATTATPTQSPGSTAVPAPTGEEVAGNQRTGTTSAPSTPPSKSATPAKRWQWIAATVVVAGLGIMAGRAMIVEPVESPPVTPVSPPTVVVLGSGSANVGGRDAENQLVSCSGPACPRGDLPQAAYVVARHSAYGAPVAGTSFIAPVPDGTTLTPPGYACCTTATFEHLFELPSNAAAGRITMTVLADNQATVSVNGVEFGGHPDRDESGNHGGPPLTFTLTFAPDPSGTNRLRVTLRDGGGAVGLQYHAVVTYEVMGG